MAGLLVNNYLLILTLLCLQLEFFFFFCYDYVIFSLKALKIGSVKKTSESKTYYSYNTNCLLFLLSALLLTKNVTSVNTILFIFVTLTVYMLCILLRTSYFFQKTNSNSIQLILVAFILFLFFFSIIDSFLSLFFLVEVYGVLYYFIFLTSYIFTNQTLLKYKNNLLIILWNNFLTTIFLSLGCLYMFKHCGTSQFSEVAITLHKNYPVYLFLVGLAWKLGLPLFHFFKLEVYKYLLRENVFIFSVITANLNTIILFFCLSIPSVYTVLYNNNLIFLIILFCSNLVLFSLNLKNILYFFALSSIITVTTIITLFIV